MPTTIHQLRAIVTSDIKQFVSGMAGAENATRKLMHAWNDARKAIATAGDRILLAVSAMTVGATKQFADFEDAMIEVGAITRTLGTRDFELLKKSALDMGEATRYTATEAAGGLKQLSLSGLDANQAIAALGPTLQLATSSGLSIGQSAAISAKMMKAMGIEARELSHVNDVLVSTFQRSNTDLGMLSEGMKHAAPLSHALGVSLEDTTAVLAKLSDAGFQGEMGGTALRNIMSRLAGAMPRMTRQFKELGIETLDSAGKMRPLLDILQDIETKGMSAGQIMELFGQRGGPQLLALMEQGISGIRRFSAETKAAAGAASAVEKARVNTIKGQWDELTSYIEGIFISAGEKIGPEIWKLIQDTEQFFRVNQPQILEEMTQAAKGLIAGLQSMSKWLIDNRHAMWEMLQTFGGLIKWVVEFLAAYPQLAAALIALKVTGILGLNAAVLQLGKALVITIQQLIALRVAAIAAATATAAAGTAGAAAATGVGAAFTGLITPGGALVVFASYLVTVGILFRQMRVTAQSELKKLEQTLDELAAKNAKNFQGDVIQNIKQIQKKESPTERIDGLARAAEGYLRQQQMWEKMRRNDNTLTDEGKENFQNAANLQRNARQTVLDALMSGLSQQYKPKFDKATDVNYGAGNDARAEFEKIKKTFADGAMTAHEFQMELESLDSKLAKITRNLDPQVDALRTQLESVMDVNTHDYDNTSKFLADLSKVKHQLGFTFQEIVNEVAFLNQQLGEGVITQQQYNAQIREMNKVVQKPAQDANTALIEGRVKEAKLQAEKDKFSEFESIQGLVGQDKDGNWDTAKLDERGIEAVGRSVEGATPEIIDSLVQSFSALHSEGEEAVKDGMDKLILSFLQSVERARGRAEEQNSLIDSANEAYKKNGTQSDVRRYGRTLQGDPNSLDSAFRSNQDAAYNGTISEEAYKDRNQAIGNVAGQSSEMLNEVTRLKDEINAVAAAEGKLGMSADEYRQSVKRLTDEFAQGKITEDEFTDKMKKMRDAISQAAAEAERLKEKEERLALLRGDFAKAGDQFDPRKALEDRLAAFRTGQFNSQMDMMFQNLMGINGVIPQVSRGFREVVDGVENFGNGIANWFESKDNGGGGGADRIQGGLNILHNSVQGAVANITNTISMVAQALNLTGLTMTRKLEIQNQIRDLIKQRDAFLSQPPPVFIGSLSDPFYRDPGLVGNAARGEQQGGQSSFSPTLNFPNLTKMNNQEVARLLDALRNEEKRRGYRV